MAPSAVPCTATHLKAANVFLTEDGSADGSIKLGDFGISKTLSTQTNLAVTACGTPFYFSPELINGKPYREPSDVWALGVLLFELLTLVRPFNGNNIAVLALNITKGKYASMARTALVALARSSSPCGHRSIEARPSLAQGCPLADPSERKSFHCNDFEPRRQRSAACPK